MYTTPGNRIRTSETNCVRTFVPNSNSEIRLSSSLWYIHKFYHHTQASTQFTSVCKLCTAHLSLWNTAILYNTMQKLEAMSLHNFLIGWQPLNRAPKQTTLSYSIATTQLHPKITTSSHPLATTQPHPMATTLSHPLATTQSFPKIATLSHP